MRIKNHKTTLQSLSDVDAALAEYGRLQCRQERVVTRMNEIINRAKEEARQKLLIGDNGETVDSRMAAIAANIEAYLLENQTAFIEERTRKLTFGTIGFRTGQPKVETAAPKLSFAALLRMEPIREKLRRWGWIRVKEDVNKEAILEAYREDKRTTMRRLSQISLRVVQEDTPWFEINRQAIENTEEK